jgi:hypothetical protein
MNLLSLVQSLQQECGVSGTILSTVGLIGSQARLLAWINTAFEEIQTKHDDWFWMRSSNILNPGVTGMQFQTVAGQASYPLGTGPGTSGVDPLLFGKWARGTFRNYTTSVGITNEISMVDDFFDIWRDSYMISTLRTVQTRPMLVAIGPDESICLGPPPSADYTITGDYFTAPTVMLLDTDIPVGLPVQFHRMIVYKAMMLYAGYEAAPEVFQKGSSNYERMMRELERYKLPQTTPGGAIA